MDKLIEYNQAYAAGSPLVSDEVYDAYVAENKLGDVPSGFGIRLPTQEKIKLPTPIHGMTKIQKENEYNNFLNGFDPNDGLVITEKLDGVALLFDLTGNLIHAYTRGDVAESMGQIIDWILEADLAEPVKRLHESQRDVMIRGELILPKQHHATIEKITGIKNPLNFVSSFINRVANRDYSLLKYLDFRAFEIFRPKQELQDELFDQLDQLARWGFKTPNQDIFHNYIEFDELQEILAGFREKSEYVIDGIILTKNIKYQRETTRDPRHARAFKCIERNVATVIGMIWSVTEMGRLNPVVVIEPFQHEGKVFTNISAKNAAFVIEERVGIGAKIIIGINVVPVLYGVLEGSDELVLPEEEHYLNGPHFYLKNPEENVTAIASRLDKFFAAINARGFGEKTSITLVEHGITTPLEFMSVDQAFLKTLFGEKRGPTLIQEASNKLLNASESKMMNASRVFPGLDEKTFDAILQSLTVEELRSGNVEKPDNIAGNVKWGVFKSGLAEYFAWKDSLGLRDKNVVGLPVTTSVTGPVTRYIMTGKPPGCTKAVFAAEFLPENFVEVSTVSKADVLIQNTGSNTAKTNEAIRKKIPVKTYEDFMK